jgi:hypothetical protein
VLGLYEGVAEVVVHVFEFEEEWEEGDEPPEE